MRTKRTPTPLRVGTRRRDPLVRVARKLRQRANQVEPAFSTMAIVKERFPDALVTGRLLPPGMLEVVSRTPQGPVIVYHRELQTSEQRFVIAHALAHLMFDGEATACRVGFVGDPATEERADRFAEELLVPLTSLRPLVDHWPSGDLDEQEIYLDMVDEIASRFQVTTKVISKRIRELAVYA